MGAGQLARMMGEAAHGAGVILTVLATSPDDAAVATCDAAIFGAANDPRSLDELADAVDVVTFDHELVDLDQLAALESRDVVVRPSAAALRFAVDKAFQRESFERVGIAVPRFVVVTSNDDPKLSTFLDAHPRVVVKAARGGYDGRGVLFPAGRAEALAMVGDVARTTTVVVEERLELRGELAQIVVRSTAGDVVAYPLVSTVQANAMCVEVRYPAALDETTGDEARRLAVQVADLIGAVGVVAVELFLTERGLVVNEIALRPHNSGHWTIEGARTSQFANHLLAVSGRALGAPDPVHDAAVMVNVVGSALPGSILLARSVPGAHVHDYGKTWRTGRKLGHVTAVGDDARVAHVTAWKSARAYGTSTRET